MNLKEIDNYADRMLAVMSSDLGHYHIYDTVDELFQDVSDEEGSTLVTYMVDKNIIEPHGGGGLIFKVSSFGIEIVKDYGGWLKYLLANETEHLKLIRLETEISKGKIRRERMTIYVAIAGVLILAYQAYQMYKTSILEGEIKTLTIERDSLSTELKGRTHLLETNGIEIQELNKSVLKLTKENDSLRQLKK